MTKPHLGDFNLTEESFQEQRRKRSQLRVLIIILSLAIGIANFRFWIWSNSVIGGWGILGLILTYYGLVPGILCGVVLDAVVGRMFYDESRRYEKAKKEYDTWFLRTQAAFWDALTGRQFEHEVANLLTRVGYGAKLTPASGDGGVDVLLADGTIVQCKAHKSRCTPAVARELYGTLQHFKAPRAILVSKSGFAKGVYDFAQGKPIILWNMNRLIEMQKQLDK